MKNFLMITAIAGLFLFVASCGGGSTTTTDQAIEKEMTETAYYTCTMHPEVHSDMQGTCPECGMELVMKDAQPAVDTMKSAPDSLLAL